MDHTAADSPDSIKPRPVGRFRWTALAVWLPACLVEGALLAWLAAIVERHRAPVLLFSLLVGVALGVTLAAMMRLCQVGHRPTILLGTLLGASVAVAGQHYLSFRAAYREARQDARAYELAKLALGNQVLGQMPVPPSSFIEFMRWRAARGFPFCQYHVRGPAVWLIWSVDWLLVLAAAAVMVVPALGRPYCDRCRSWYATTRRGRLDPAAARQVAALAGAELPDGSIATHYRLVACHSGCGPTGLLLRWERPSGDRLTAESWLDADRRNRVVEALDRATDTQS